MSFSTATAGLGQNVTQQNQWALSFNGASTATMNPQIYGNGSLQPLYASFSNTIGADAFGIICQVTGDTAGIGRLSLGIKQSNLGGQFYSNSGAATGPRWYIDSGTSWRTGSSVSIASTLQIDGTSTLSGLSVANASTISGTLSCTGTITGSAANIANLGLVLTGTANVNMNVSDDGTNVYLTANAPGGSSRGIQLITTDSGGSTHAALTANYDGSCTANAPLALFLGGSITRISVIQSCSIPFVSCSPSCYGSATISHGLGTTPTAAVTNTGGGGTDTYNNVGGFDLLGSSTLRCWLSESSGPNYLNLVCYHS